MHTLRQWWPLLLGTCGLWLGGCSSGLLPHTVTYPMALSAPGDWQDGSYTGTSDRGDLPTPQLIRVTMDIAGGRIVTVRVHQPPGWNAPPGEELLLRRVLEQSSTGLEPPAPAGSEAEQLLRALDDASTKARAFELTPP
ncbi:MAG TPA: hypothetical protein VI542_31250 [Candidatus Tectomicrobia bacterium]